MWSGSKTATDGWTRTGEEGTSAATAFLALGSNVGDRRRHLRDALAGLAALGRITAVSSLYETDPVGFEAQGRFLNLVLRMDTTLSPRELLTGTRAIELAQGRKRTFPNAPRTLDIDLLLHDDRIVHEPGLEVPHPRMRDRLFVLIPLLEIDRSLRDPTTGAPYADRLAVLLGGRGAAAAGVERISAGREWLDVAEGEGG